MRVDAFGGIGNRTLNLIIIKRDILPCFSAKVLDWRYCKDVLS
jgi:hypothetical protein